MRLTKTYLNNGESNPKTCIWFLNNKQPVIFIFHPSRDEHIMREAYQNIKRFNSWKDTKEIILPSKQEWKEIQRSIAPQ